MKAFNEKIILRNVAIDPSGGGKDLIAAINTPVTVYQTGTTNLADIFDLDENPIPNPTSTDIKGNVVFKVGNGVYDIVGGTGENETRWDEVEIIDLNTTGLDKTYATVADMKADTSLQANGSKLINTVDYHSTQRGGGASYLIKTTAQADADGDAYSATTMGNILLDNGNVAVLQHNIGGLIGLQFGLSSNRQQASDSQGLQEIFDTVTGTLCDEINLDGCKLELTQQVVASFDREIRIFSGEVNGNSIFIDGCVDNCKILQTSFKRDSLVNGDTPGTIGIQIRNTRKLTIHQCRFENIDRSIFSNQTSTGFHTIGQTLVTENRFDRVNYALFLDHDRSDDFVISDLTFSNNFVGESYISALFAYSLDGLVMNGNTVFSSSQGTIKAENVRISALSDQIVITNNNLFTPGKENIRLVDPKSAVITGNNLVWAGTRVISSSIYISGTQSEANIKISSNLIQGATKSSIEIDIDFPLQALSGNQLVGDENPIYYGGIDYLNLPRYGIEDRSTGVHKPALNDYFDYEFDYLYKDFKFSAGQHGIFAQNTIDVSSPDVPLFQFKEQNGTTSDYSIKVKVFAEKGTSQTATYYLTLNQSAIGNEINLDGAYGLATGGSGWPSFTFDLSNNQLLATPNGLGGGLVTFTCSVVGETNGILEAV